MKTLAAVGTEGTRRDIGLPSTYAAPLSAMQLSLANCNRRGPPATLHCLNRSHGKADQRLCFWHWQRHMGDHQGETAKGEKCHKGGSHQRLVPMRALGMDMR
jgi:hypothetical protein